MFVLQIQSLNQIAAVIIKRFPVLTPSIGSGTFSDIEKIKEGMTYLKVNVLSTTFTKLAVFPPVHPVSFLYIVFFQAVPSFIKSVFASNHVLLFITL